MSQLRGPLQPTGRDESTSGITLRTDGVIHGWSQRRETPDELERLTREHIESMKSQTFLGITPEDLLREKERMQRIREVSADYLEALKRLLP